MLLALSQAGQFDIRQPIESRNDALASKRRDEAKLADGACPDAGTRIGRLLGTHVIIVSHKCPACNG
jgi:hypothetical protein